MLLSTKIRRSFIQYFVKHAHRHFPSSSVVPHQDPTLLFNNAGMNQFKSYFLGIEEPSSPRAVTSQKCIRVGGKHNDLENVGHTTRHLTFFEMLGNFSFGDYFKKEAIDFAWDVTMNIFKFDIDKLWVSVYSEDQEAYEYWTKHLPASRIVKIATDDNFWAMGEFGLCGPCTELFYDKGEKFGSARSPAEDVKGERFFEFWNLVFMQYDRETKNIIHPLPKPCVDTGGGLERIVSLMMGVDNIFETDLLMNLIETCEPIFDLKYKEQNAQRKAAFHVIVDHLRTLSFAIADGVQPSNLDRGYVLRKVLRRAVRYGRLLGAQKPFLGQLVPQLVHLMHEDFPELKVSQERILELLYTEEEAFIRTLKKGGNLLTSVIKKAQDSKKQLITGDDAFKLKDTYGLPLEEIQLMAKDSNLSVDLERYRDLEQKAKEISKQASVGVVQKVSEGFYKEFLENAKRSEFCGYDQNETHTKVLGIVKDDQWVNELSSGDSGQIVLSKTPFYAELGGQVGDTGTLNDERDLIFKVKDTKAPYTGVIVHEGHLLQGSIQVGESVTAKIDVDRRKKIERNHTATHLLHWALVEVLGEHVKQAGSLVEPHRLRFDFSHHKGLSEEHLCKIEDLVNSKIRANIAVGNYELLYQDVHKRQDIKQFFGDKYGEKVRVVDIDFCKELCGGTHTSQSGNIGFFKLTKEGSIAAGVRRIEAVTGTDAEQFCRQQEELIQSLSTSLKTTPSKLTEKLSQFLFEHKNLMEHNRQLALLRNEQIIDQLLSSKEEIGSISFVCHVLDLPKQQLREFTEQLLKKSKQTISILAAHESGSVSLVVAMTKDIGIQGLSAKGILAEIVEPINGRGGGKSHFAQAGGTHPENLPQVFENARKFLIKSC
ncbi:MAG: Alanine--tRNA ligase [Chlamydiae bacterium]|nr:Alanine--tRNA ligase [Chlamydiota bacterium]